MSYVASHKIYNHWLTIFTVLLGTGGRIGEITSLRWKDCDFETNTISINQNMVYRKFGGEKKSTFHIITPKTNAGIRTIPMLEEVKTALQSEWELQKVLGFNESIIDGYTGFIFQNRYGDPLSAHNVNRAIERIYTEYKEDFSKLEGKIIIP